METTCTFSPQRRKPTATTGRPQNVPVTAIVLADENVEKRRFVTRNRSDMALRLEQSPMKNVRKLMDPKKRTSALKEIQECSKEYTLPWIKNFVADKKILRFRSLVVVLAGLLMIRQLTAFKGFSWLPITGMDVITLQQQKEQSQQQQDLISSSSSTTTTTPQIKYPDDRTVIDILSIVQSRRGTSSTLSSSSSLFTDIQKKYLSSHRHVRNYVAFDRDLSEPNCAATLTKTHIIKVIDSCSRTDSQSYVSSQVRKSLFQPKLDIAWMCTQLRVLDGVYDYLKQYGNHLPEYLILTSDSTFLDMEELVHTILDRYNDASVMPHVIAGCKQGNPQFEYADVLQSGLILSKRALEKFIQPIDCEGGDDIPENNNDHSKAACWRLRVPAFRERDYYYAKSSILDVMHEFSIANSFTRVDTWGDATDQNIGFCWSGSHALSYFINFYFLPVPDGVLTRDYKGVAKDKIRKRNPMHDLGYCDAKCTTESPKICGDLSAKQLLHKFQVNPHYGGGGGSGDITKTGIADSDWATSSINNDEEEAVYHKSLPNPYEGKKEVPLTIMEDEFTIDVISIGDTSRSDYQEMQQETIGTMVRNFYRVTEYDDFDRTCPSTVSSVEKVLNVCGNLRDHSHIAETMNKRLFRPAKDDVNALCAQKRLIDGLHKTLKQNYKQDSDIPNYLWIIKDETYVNVPSLRDELIRHHYSQNPEEPQSWALAGCVSHSGFTTPEFQHGMFLSKASVQKLLRPIDCEAPLEKTKDKKDKFISHACRRLKVNAIGERMFFQNGMSLLDWMHEFSLKLLFSKVDSWLDAGFCFHSEHFLAYFVNFYRVSDSHSFLGLRDDENRCIKGTTNTEEIKCEVKSKICKRVEPREMKRLFKVQAAAEKKRRKKAKKKVQ